MTRRREEPVRRGELSLVLEMLRAESVDDPFAFRSGPQEYTLRSSTGAVGMFRVVWSDELERELVALRDPGRDPSLLRRLGEAARAWLDPVDWRVLERELLAAVDAGTPIVITVCSNAAELYRLPWELLLLPTSGQHLGRLPGLVVRHEWPGTSTRPERTRPRPEGGRILVAWSNAGGGVPGAEHIAAIQSACLSGHPQGLDGIEVLAGASVDGIVAALRRARDEELAGGAQGIGRAFSVLHLLCHGGAVGSTFGLVLDDARGPVAVDAETLRARLGEFADTLRLVVLCACESGNPGEPGNYLGSVAQALHRVGIESVIASREPLSTAGSIRLTRALYDGLLGRPLSLEAALGDAREALARHGDGLEWPSLQLHARAADGSATFPVVFRPFRGLLTFYPEHHRFFFGRNSEVEELLSDLAALERCGKPRFIVVAGASGTGKSSVVLAGAVPRLFARGLRLAQTRPGDGWDGPLNEARKLAGPEGQVLLVVDQFEEVFTHERDPERRSEFAKRLWSLARDPGSRVSVIIAVRVDFIGRYGELLLDAHGTRLDRIAYDEAYLVLVAQMNPEQLRAAIEKPAALVGLEFERGLVDRMLTEVAPEPGALPLLEHILDLLWQHREGRVLTHRAYDLEGGVSGALVRHADALITALPEDDARVAARVLTNLVTGDESSPMTRKRVPLSELLSDTDAESAQVVRVLDLLAKERLVVKDREKHRRETMVEVAHETLIRRWKRLHQWIDEARALSYQVKDIEEWIHQFRRTGTLPSRWEVLQIELMLRTAADDPRAGAERWREDAAVLLRASRRRRVWRRVRDVVLGVALALLVVYGVQAWRLTYVQGLCDAEGAAIHEKWRSRADQRPRSLVDIYGDETAGAIVSLLTDHAEQWKDEPSRACREFRIDNRWSPERYERTVLCFEQRTRELDELWDAMHDPQRLDPAVRRVAELPGPHTCRDRQVLREILQDRDAEDLKRALSAARAALDGPVVANDDAKNGLADAALAVELSGQSQRPVSLASAYLIQGKLLARLGRPAEAEKALETSYYKSVAVANSELAFDAAAELVYVTGHGQLHYEDGERWYEHAKGLLEVVQQHRELREATLQHRFAAVMLRRGEWSEARIYADDVFKTRVKLLGPKHPTTLATRTFLAEIDRERRDLKRAEEQLRQVLAMQREVLKNEQHPELLATREALDQVTTDPGDLVALKARFTAHLDDERRSRSENDKDTLKSQVRLALVLHRLGQVEEARALVDDALARQERETSRAKDPELLDLLRQAADVCRERSELELARSYLERARTLSLEIHGAEHPTTADIHLGLGTVLLGQDDHRGAIDQFTQALAAVEKRSGVSHPNTWTPILSLLAAYAAEGASDGVSTQLRRLQGIDLQRFGDELPTTGLSLYKTIDEDLSRQHALPTLAVTRRALARLVLGSPSQSLCERALRVRWAQAWGAASASRTVDYCALARRCFADKRSDKAKHDLQDRPPRKWQELQDLLPSAGCERDTDR